MTSARPSFRTPRLPLRLARHGGRGARLAFAVAMVAQLLAMVIVPVLHASAARPLGAHVEQPGTPHRTHDDASCATCSVSHALGDAPRAPRGIPRAVDCVVDLPAAECVTPPVVARCTDAAPRAPPTAVRVG